MKSYLARQIEEQEQLYSNAESTDIIEYNREHGYNPYEKPKVLAGSTKLYGKPCNPPAPGND